MTRIGSNIGMYFGTIAPKKGKQYNDKIGLNNCNLAFFKKSQLYQKKFKTDCQIDME